MTERITINLWEPVQAHKALGELWIRVKALLIAGHRLVVSVSPVSKTREQEEKYHAMIGEIAVQARHLGATWDEVSWKRLLLDEFAKETDRPRGKLIPSLSGDGVVEVGLLSRKFTKADGIEFIEFLHAWGAEREVIFKEQA